MRADVHRLSLSAGNGQAYVLVVTPEVTKENAPVLLFLHGKGEASPYLNELPKVCFHLSPPFEAIRGTLQDVIVVAPQAPRKPEDGWSWRPYTADLARFLATGPFRGRLILATGFSRGGLGVLQLVLDAPGCVSKWAIVEPQRAEDAQESGLLPQSTPCKEGWMRYGNALPKNKPFADRLAARLDPRNVQFADRGHSDLCLLAYGGDRLLGPQSLYEFLGLTYQPSRSDLLKEADTSQAPLDRTTK